MRLPPALRRFLRQPAAVAGAVLLLLVIGLAASADLLYPEDPFEIVGRPYLPPLTGEFLLGTDTLGRDLAAGIVHGARVSLLIGTLAALVVTAIGILVGGAAGYVGGRVDTLLMRFTELFQTIPSFLFAIVLVAIMEPSLNALLIAIVVVSWAPLARLVRAEVAGLRSRDYVQSAIAIGMGDASVLARQILPNALPAILVAASVMVATAILFESGLSFLGLGDPNVMSWGLMIGAGRSAIRTAWWMAGIPGIAILLTVLSINLVGDGLNEALNPRAAGRA
ncbi:peptide/nickel transport system permease protein [Roseomonas rosea]|uniref:Peptide/nickel transport system permease protein n=1 Tax=Muricoccus roseus TaxID=198092 RepID=A0A1M6LUP6_9PROT|nr:ABC transporter permease [Roseomonas rosea]SHJ74865.1 peptide/nickel transport system permease protein [Roseomonas rosea]